MSAVVIVLLLLVVAATGRSPYNVKIMNKGFKDGGVLWEKPHQPIIPRLYHGLHNTLLQSTRQENGEHMHHITLRFHADDESEIVVDLQLNRELLPQDHFLHYQIPNGDGYVLKNFTLQNIDHCHYVGNVRDRIDSSVAISTCDNAINGFIFDGSQTFYIHSTSTTGFPPETSSHYLLRQSALNLANDTCSYEGTYESNSHNYIGINGRPENVQLTRIKRSTDATKIRGPYNSNPDSSFVELILVVDNKLYKAMDSSLQRVHNHCKMISNIINAVYTPLNIFIALIGVVVWSENNEIELSNDGDKTLKNFLHYRRKSLVKRFPNDNAQLLTREQFDGGVVGKALKGPICTYEFSGGVAMDHSQIVGVVATTVAHEIGHNFGMEHDTADCKCPDERCIMSASSSSVAPKHWSSCSIDQLNLAFHQGMNYCLRNKPKSLFDSPQCGNGFVENGEQCDCGLPQFCDNTCCDPYTCMLLENATCATGSCCDLTTCRPRQAGTLCRDANGECDLPEYCLGESEYCPRDVFKRDTEECGKGRAYCYEGSCRSRTDQCRVLWGISGNSSDECYTKNENASRHGNCGYDRVANEYVKCHPEDIYCGMLHCRHTNEKLEFGMENVAVLSHSFLNHENRIVACRTAIVDLGLESIDPGLTPNGAKCGDGKMCVNQHCLTIDEVLKTGKGRQCPNTCNGHGVCNSEGSCHCEVGFAPPNCIDPGPGGSVDSGPASNPDVGEGFALFLIIVCGILLPLAALVFCVFWCRKNNPDQAFLFKCPFNMSKPIIKCGSSGIGSTNASNNTNAILSPDISATTSPDDINASLLRPGNDEIISNNTMFGKFKGFSMRPLQERSVPSSTSALGPNVAFVQPVSKNLRNGQEFVTMETATNNPVRAAPAVPQSHRVSENADCNRTTNKAMVSLVEINDQGGGNGPPALPPLNPGSHPRPLISNPIFESTTSTAKEMLSSLTDGKPPGSINSEPLLETISPNINFALKPLPPINNKSGTLQRIKSLISRDVKPATPVSVISAVPLETDTVGLHKRNTPKFIDRNRLKTIEISLPIPQLETQTKINNRKSMLARTHSMREEASETAHPHLMSFGSTRGMRPKSIVTSRPKGPPPPRPPAPCDNSLPCGNPTSLIAQCDMNSYERPPAPRRVEFEENQQFDAASMACDATNIYAVIDEHCKNKELNSEDNASMESLGLLGEIVNEIENRNDQSIYSSGLQKPQNDEKGDQCVNTNAAESLENKSPEHIDDNARNLKTNTNSRGYLKSIQSMPIARVAPSKTNYLEGNKTMESIKKPVSQNFKKFDQSGARRPFGQQLSEPNINLSKQLVGVSVAGSANKPIPPNKPVFIKCPNAVPAKIAAPDTAPSNSKGERKPLSNVGRMQRKFETAQKK